MLMMPFGTFDTNKKHYLKKKKTGVRLGRGPRVDPGLTGDVTDLLGNVSVISWRRWLRSGRHEFLFLGC